MAKNKHKEETEQGVEAEANTNTNTAGNGGTVEQVLTVSYPSKGKSFTLPRRYEEGHTLSVAEANALNGLVVENIRNNFSKQLEKEWPTDEALNSAFAEYAQAYEFAGKRASRAPVDPVQREAEKIAAGKIDEALRKIGKSRKNLAEGVFDKHVQDLLAKQPSILEEAKRRVETTKAIGVDSIADILASEVQEPVAEAAAA